MVTRMAAQQDPSFFANQAARPQPAIPPMYQQQVFFTFTNSFFVAISSLDLLILSWLGARYSHMKVSQKLVSDFKKQYQVGIVGVASEPNCYWVSYRVYRGDSGRTMGRGAKLEKKEKSWLFKNGVFNFFSGVMGWNRVGQFESDNKNEKFRWRRYRKWRFKILNLNYVIWPAPAKLFTYLIVFSGDYAFVWDQNQRGI